MILISVDLPAPFSPTSACTSPGAQLKLTSLSARTPGNDFEMCDISIAARATGSFSPPRMAICTSTRPSGLNNRLVTYDDPESTVSSNEDVCNRHGLSEASTMLVMCSCHDASSASDSRSRRKIVDSVQRLE